MATIRDKEVLGEYADDGFMLEESDDHVVVVWFKETMIAAFSQLAATKDELRGVCKRFKDRANGNPSVTEIRNCHNCIQWRDTKPWRGNCNKHPWEHDRWSESATAGDCPDYIDKSTLYAKQYATKEG